MGYVLTQCVSYTAWKVYQKNGYMPYWGGVGNANQWPGNADSAGIGLVQRRELDRLVLSWLDNMDTLYGLKASIRTVRLILVSTMSSTLAVQAGGTTQNAIMSTRAPMIPISTFKMYV